MLSGKAIVNSYSTESNYLWKFCTVRELFSHWVEIKPKSLWWVEIIRNKKYISSVHGLVHPACNVIWWGVVGVLFTLSIGNLKLQLRPENAIPHFFVLICLLPSKSRISLIFWWMYKDITIGVCHCRLPWAQQNLLSCHFVQIYTFLEKKQCGKFERNLQSPVVLYSYLGE